MQKVTRIFCALLLLAAVIPIFWTIYPLFIPVEHVIQDDVDGASIEFIVARPTVGFDGCTDASWNVEGVESVFFWQLFDTAQGVTGQDSTTICPEMDTRVFLSVNLADETQHAYTVDVVQSTAKLLPMYLVLIGVLLVAAVGMAMPVGIAALRPYPVIPMWHRHSVALVVLTVIVVVMYLPTYFNIIGGDFQPHLDYAQSIRSWDDINTPHFFYHLMVIAVAPLMPAAGIEAYYQAGYVLFIASSVVTAWILYGFIRGVFDIRNPLVLVGLTLAILVITPLTLPTLFSNNLYAGYIQTINLFHNPTTIALKPFTVGLFWLTAQLMFHPESRRVWMIGVFAIGTVISLFIKPNLMIILLPPIGLYLLYELIMSRQIRWGLVLGAVIPAIPVLLFQYVGFFTEAAEAVPAESLQGPEFASSSVIFAPFAVFLTREPSAFLLGIKFLLAIAFPLVMYLSDISRWRKNNLLNLAWVVFIFGAIFSYFFAEGGERLTHGNFVWSGQIGLFLLLMVSMLAYVQWWRDEKPNSSGFLLSGTLLLLHLVSGVIWHGVNLASGYGFFWW